MTTDLQKVKKLLQEFGVEFSIAELLDDTTHLRILDNHVNSIDDRGVDIVFNSRSEEFVEFEV